MQSAQLLESVQSRNSGISFSSIHSAKTFAAQTVLMRAAFAIFAANKRRAINVLKRRDFAVQPQLHVHCYFQLSTFTRFSQFSNENGPFSRLSTGRQVSIEFISHNHIERKAQLMECKKLIKFILLISELSLHIYNLIKTLLITGFAT